MRDRDRVRVRVDTDPGERNQRDMGVDMGTGDQVHRETIFSSAGGYLIIEG